MKLYQVMVVCYERNMTNLLQAAGVLYSQVKL